MIVDLDGKTVLVTGGNAGIGKATVQALAARGATVLLCSRDERKGEWAAEEVRVETGRPAQQLRLDLASFASIRAAAEQVLAEHGELDVLVNNAGLILSDRRLTEDGFEQTFGVNHLGHFLLTQLLRPALERAAAARGEARVVTVASRAHRRAKRGLDFDDLQSARGYEGMDAYAKSKLANIYFSRALARRLAGTGVTSNALHPGVVATRFARDGDARGVVSWFFTLFRPFLKSEAQGAATSIHLASAPALKGVTGKYFADCREATPTPIAQDDEAAERLWRVSEELVADASGRGI